MAGEILDPKEKRVVRANTLFTRMLEASHRQGKGSKTTLDCVLIGIDPGETTGFAYRLPWEDGFKVYLKQLATKNIPDGIATIMAAWPEINRAFPVMVVMEDYRVYSWKADNHSWQTLHTPKLIGALELWLHQQEYPFHYQMASEAKQWADDQKLKSWDLYEPGLKHARDAKRHIVTYAFFGQPEKDLLRSS